MDVIENIARIKNYEDESEKIEELVNFLENNLSNLYEQLSTEDFTALLGEIITILESFKDIKILENRAQKIVYEMKDYIGIPELNRMLDCFQYSLTRQINTIVRSRNLFNDWKFQEGKCMLVEVLKNHSIQEQDEEQLSVIAIRNISNIASWYLPIEKERILSDLLDNTNFQIGIQIWNNYDLELKSDRSDVLINLLKKGLVNTYDTELNSEFGTWVNDNFSALQKIDARLFDKKILDNVSLNNFEKILLIPEIHPYLIAYKENTPIIKFIINSLEKDENKENIIDIFEQLKDYQMIIGESAFSENTTDEEITSVLKTLINYKSLNEEKINDIPLNRKFEIINSNFELQTKMWEALPKEIRKDNIDILRSIIQAKLGDYLPENIDQSFFENLNNSIDLSKLKAINTSTQMSLSSNNSRHINMIEKLNSPMLSKNIMDIIPFEKMIQILPHKDIEGKILEFSDNPQLLKMLEYVMNNSVNWRISLHTLLENMESPEYENLIEEISNYNLEELYFEKLVRVFSNTKNYFSIQTMDDVANFTLTQKNKCLQILEGEEPENMSWEYEKLSKNDKMKFAFLQLSFGIDIEQATELVKKYGTDIENMVVSDDKDNKIKNMIGTLKIILDPKINIKNLYIQNKDTLLNLNSNPVSYGFSELEAESLNLYTNLYNQSLGIKQEEIRTINYNGTDIRVHEVTGDFNALIRVEQNVDIENEASEFIERTYINVPLQSNGNCKTYIGQNFINFVQTDNNCLLWGYMHCQENSLHYAASRNIVSAENNFAFSPGSSKSDIGNGIELRIPSKIIDNSRRGINETTTQKWQYNSEVGKIEVDSPDLIIYIQETNDTNIENDEKWKTAQMVASKLGKDILIIPREKCAQREYSKLEEMKQRLLETSERKDGETDEVLIEKLIVEFNNNRTGIITSPILREKYFTEEQNIDMINCISERMENLKQSDPDKYEETLQKVCQTMQEEIHKFYAISYDSQDNSLDIDKVRNYLNPYEEFLKQHETVNLNIPNDRKSELDTLMKEITQTDFYDMNEIHSIEHIEKVMLFSSILANNEGLSEEDTHLLLLAAAFHDSGRNGKDGDDKHAEASAQQIENYFNNNPQNPFGINMSNLAMIQTAIHYHEYEEPTKGNTDFEEIHKLCNLYGVSEENFERTVKLCELLKDADALDRARFGLRSQNRWALNTDYLKSETAKSVSMIKFAEDVNLNIAKATGRECYNLENLDEQPDSKIAKLQSEIRSKHLPYDRIQQLINDQLQTAKVNTKSKNIPIEKVKVATNGITAIAKKEAINSIKQQNQALERGENIDVVTNLK